MSVGFATLSFMFYLKNFIFNFYWSVLNLQCCFRCTAKWFRFICIFFILTSIFFIMYPYICGVSLEARSVKNSPTLQETRDRSLGQKDPLEEGMATHSSILAWKNLMDGGTWQAIVHGVAKSWTLHFHFNLPLDCTWMVILQMNIIYIKRRLGVREPQGWFRRD